MLDAIIKENEMNDNDIFIQSKKLYELDPNNLEYQRQYIRLIKKNKQAQNIKHILETNYKNHKDGIFMSETLGYDFNYRKLIKIVYKDTHSKEKYTFTNKEHIATIIDNIKLDKNKETTNCTFKLYMIRTKSIDIVI